MTRSLLYVACSRATTTNGLFIIGQFQAPQPPNPNDPISIELIRQESVPLYPCFQLLHEPLLMTFQLMFHNVQSIGRHLIRIVKDPAYLCSHILLFAETWTSSTDKYIFRVSKRCSGGLQGRQRSSRASRSIMLRPPYLFIQRIRALHEICTPWF